MDKADGTAAAAVADLAEMRARRERARLDAFERELRRRLCAFLDGRPVPRDLCGTGGPAPD
ncbi:hypothetical protein [Arenibaculum sp.]|uniref:hypothetical protein n=1 Tax=Arenibaculum sp. TaxID=2865862 RepID=UPI002E15B5F1|nr:hypothetical protein [Arenibaculum sp.]